MQFLHNKSIVYIVHKFMNINATTAVGSITDSISSKQTILITLAKVSHALIINTHIIYVFI